MKPIPIRSKGIYIHIYDIFVEGFIIGHRMLYPRYRKQANWFWTQKPTVWELIW